MGLVVRKQVRFIRSLPASCLEVWNYFFRNLVAAIASEPGASVLMTVNFVNNIVQYCHYCEPELAVKISYLFTKRSSIA